MSPGPPRSRRRALKRGVRSWARSQGAGHALTLAFLVAFGLAFTHPLALRLGTHLSNPGDPLLTAWMLAWDSRTLLNMDWPLFDANIFYPYEHSFAFSEHLFGLALLGLPFWIATKNALFTNNALLLLCFVGSSFAMYALAFTLTRSPTAGVVAGIAFGYNPFRVFQVSHLHLQGVLWLPLIVLFLIRYMERRRVSDLLLFLVCFLMQSLSGFYLFASALLTVIVFAAGGLWLAPRRSAALRALGGLAVAGLVVALVNLPFVLPYVDVRGTLGLQRSLDEAETYAAWPTDFLRVSRDNELYGSWLGSLPGSPEGALFPGVTAAFLAGLGIVGIGRRKLRREPAWGRTAPVAGTDLSAENAGLAPQPACEPKPDAPPANRRWAYCFVALAVVAFVLSLGPWAKVGGAKLPLPYLVLYETMPLMGALRVPTRFALPLMLAVAALAALGCARLEHRLRSPRRGAQGGLAAVLVALLFAEYASFPFPAAAQPFDHHRRDALDARLAALGPRAIVVELPMTTAPRPPWWFDDGPYSYLYASTRHWRDLVNGLSGFYPPGYLALTDILDTFPSPAAGATLLDLGVTHVVLHLDRLPRGTRERIELNLAQSAGYRIEAHYAESLLLRLPRAEPQQLVALWHVPRRIPAGSAVLSAVELRDGTGPTTLYPSAPLRVRDAAGGLIELAAAGELPVSSLPFRSTFLPLSVALDPAAEGPLALELETGRHRLKLEAARPVLDPALATSRQPGVLRARLEEVESSSRVHPGKPFWARVRVRNVGAGYWEARGDPDGRGEVRVALRSWTTLDGDPVEVPGPRAPIPHAVAPRETATVQLTAAHPEVPGVYIARLEMVSESVEWSSDLDPGAFAEVEVRVVAPEP